MSQQWSVKQLNARYSELTARCLELKLRIADCESYLHVADSLISTEEQQRAAFDIEDYQQELESLAVEADSIRNQLDALSADGS